jgi:hypothetical protein
MIPENLDQSNEIKQPKTFKTNEIFSPALIFLFIIWFAVLFFLSLPVASDFSPFTKVLAFLPPIALTLLVVLTKPKQGFYIWAICITLLITQTGFQLEVGGMTTSGLEFVILFLLILLLFLRRQGIFFSEIPMRLPGWQAYSGFFLFSLSIFFFGLVRGDSIFQALFELKGFLIYPLMGYLFVIGIRNFNQLRLLVFIMIAWYIFIAGRGLLEYRSGIVTSTEIEIFRSSGGYAPTNFYGITLAVIIIITLSISFTTKNIIIKAVGFLASFWMLLGMIASASRAAILSFVVGLLVLFVTNRKRKFIWIFIFGVMLLVFIAFPELTINRIFQFSDSSTLSREYYLQSGMAALKKFWVVGSGWGNGYWLDPIYGLYPSGAIPWYHNDYLNIAVQIGIFGLIIYLGYWFFVVREGYRWLIKDNGSELRPYIQGFFAALATLLTAALFEHVLWRPDIAGLVGWVSGMLIAAIYLERFPETRSWENQSPS